MDRRHQVYLYWASSRKWASLLLLLLIAMPLDLSGANPGWLSGDEIAQRINARDEGKAVSRTVTMELINRRGKKRIRETRLFRRNVGDERQSILFYTKPRNVKGTAFLTLDYPDRDDNQWLYLPALRKTRRISAANRGDYFLGTDFTYEDIKLDTRVGYADYTWKTTGEETIEGHRCYIVEGIPVNPEIAKELGYSRLLAWVDKDIWMGRKIEYWDVQGNPLKRVVLQNIRQVQGIWTVHYLEAFNHKTGHRSVLTFRDVDYQQHLKDDLFTQRALRRGL